MIENMMKIKKGGPGRWIGLAEARAICFDKTPLIDKEEVHIIDCSGRVAFCDMTAIVNSPSVTASLKDGYAVHSSDVAAASRQNPIRLVLSGTSAAGDSGTGPLATGCSARILTGAPLPQVADAVVSQEFVNVQDGFALFTADADPGRNVLVEGADVRIGEIILRRGEIPTPGRIGLLAAAGVSTLPVYRMPRILLIATGDEIVEPGTPLKKGGLYASNLVTLASYSVSRGLHADMRIVSDSPEYLKQAITGANGPYDALCIIGGAWDGDRDFTMSTLDELGWEPYFRRVRMGPGKAVSFGRLGGKPAFSLPGGPPSNHIAFLQLVLPSLLHMGGHMPPYLPLVRATLTEEVSGQEDWTQFIHAKLSSEEGELKVTPLRSKSRLRDMADCDSLIEIPEGKTRIERASIIDVQRIV
ncbi:MAG: hypothetical protein A2W19_06615 [Spirochaetes bacterium RBG_16_49_21]|nr:MAG: hypothetical protein A2W19_06615 [Spirochaetes bacterium RBG_16_49_21]